VIREGVNWVILMANRYLRQFFYTMHAMPVLLDLNCDIGASGAPSNLVGPGITSITRLSAGRYQIKLQDNYRVAYGVVASLQAPVSGSAIDPNAGAVGTVYQITTVGATDWATAGLPTGLTPTVGQVLKLAAAPTASTGRVKAIGVSGITCVEIVGDTNDMLSPLPTNNVSASNKGGIVTIQCLGATDASTTTLIPKDPADGSRLYVIIYLSNSSVTQQGE